MNYPTGKDIETHDDIEFVLRNFLGRVLINPSISPCLSGINAEELLTELVCYWNSVTLRCQWHPGNLFNRLSLQSARLGQLRLMSSMFCELIDEFYAGPHASCMKQKLTGMAIAYWYKLGDTRCAMPEPFSSTPGA